MMSSPFFHRRSVWVAVLLVLAATRLHAQVTLQTGSATFTLPIFSWQDDKSRLSSIVALHYNSGSGLKVNDVSSNVGQGWNLMWGGVVTRLQVGEPDDQVAYDGTSELDTRSYPNGILYAATPASNGCPAALAKYPIYKSMNQVYRQHNSTIEDKQRDYFSFQFNGKTGLFALDGSTNTGVMLGDSKIKIAFTVDLALPTGTSSGIRTVITSFTITDIDGTIYKFTKHGLTKVLKTEFCDGSLQHPQVQPKFQDNGVYHQTDFDELTMNPWIINSWYLSEIEDGLTGRKVIFHYKASAEHIDARAGDDIAYYATSKHYCLVSHKRSVSSVPMLDWIEYPDQHRVNINYAASSRIDLPGDYAIQSIDVLYNGRTLSRHKLATTYVIRSRYGKPVSDYEIQSARLYLRSVQKIGIDLKEDSPPYFFDYYLGGSAADDIVPPPFFYARDPWGYYNGANSLGWNNESIAMNSATTALSFLQLKGLCFIHASGSGGDNPFNSKSGYARNGLLKQIIYPTSGTLAYEYAQNAGVYSSGSHNAPGVHVSATSATDGGYSNDCDHAIKTSYSFVLSDGTSSSLWGLEDPICALSTDSHYGPVGKYYHWTLANAPAGACDWHYQYPGILSSTQAIDLPGWVSMMNTLGPALGVLNVISTIKDLVTALSASGNPVALAIDIVLDLIQIALTCIGDHARDATTYVFNNYDMNMGNPLPMQFKRVEIVENPGTIGKTIQEFTSDDDYAIWVPTNPIPSTNTYSSRQRFAPWAYGLPLHTLVNDASGNKVKEIINAYDFTTIISGCGHLPCIAIPKVPLRLNSCKCFVVKNSSQKSSDYNDPLVYDDAGSYLTSSSSDILVELYDLYTGRVPLISTTEKMYNIADQTHVAQTQTTYTYNNINYEVATISTANSNGDSYSKSIKYSCDYTGGFADVMNNNNMVAIPIESSTGVSSSNPGLTDESVTEYTQLSDGELKPSRILDRRFAKPDNTILVFYGGPGSSVTSLGFKEVETFSYDANGNLVGGADEGGRKITNIYDYADKYLVASVINADAASDISAYSSFEVDNSFGGWTLGGTAAYYTSASVTGARSLTLSGSNSLSRSLSSSKTYKLSFWAASSVSVSGTASLVLSSPTLNGFTYYEYNIPTGNSSVSITGSTHIDELRLYPSNARMRTIAYDPAIGKTEDCDENNRITFYGYDNLGRLQFIKDEHKNIVKMYEYNSVSPAKQNGCPGLYYNHLLSETFVKECTGNDLGTDVTFTIAANTYSSTLSQEDADAQAENELLANGQAYANTNGSCQVVYWNTAHSQSFTTQNCEEGYTGGTVTYSVPAHSYSSLISQADADQQALDDILANGQAYANDPANASCVINYDYDYQWLDGAETSCQYYEGDMHLFVLATDMNPNSATYLQTCWQDSGISEACGLPDMVFSLGIENNTSCTQYVTVTNSFTNESYFFTVNPYSSNSLGSIPVTNYNVTVSNSCSGVSVTVGCSGSGSGNPATVTHALIDNICNAIVIN